MGKSAEPLEIPLYEIIRRPPIKKNFHSMKKISPTAKQSGYKRPPPPAPIFFPQQDD